MKHNKLIQAIELFRSLDREMQAQQMLIFLYIAAAGKPVPLPKIQAALDLSQAAISRNVAALGALHWRKKQGHGLVRTWDNPENLREKLVELTVAGKRLDGIIEALVGG